ncbi:hypothetical protein GO988_19575 [Hymenobacter sp. HMF4947]|uniref:Carboxypeptidase-like regulatory domain-containing protein n=1 Tax=Hymenobacter ginkgonis TaxID=2682976 RepID=A0A7K1TJE1_9BACT|nr:carboxypeptidase-like regulatory domain-containing protein [Hymenobacter ginkgonis]MVN78538.1 hypothetical protein [Hymenobacter ginkgonis]
MGFSRIYFLVVCLVSLAGSALAQGRLNGVVQDSVTHEPLAFASVFLANTTLGATTTEDGKFDFPRVPKGNYDVVASYVGYRLAKQNITVGTAAQSVTLRPASSGPQLGEVVIHANPHQEDDYRKFTGLFLGTTTFAKQCRISNPDAVLVAYNDTTKELTASAENFVQVENEALGYRLKYFGLRFNYNTESESVSYDGQPVFEAMTPRDDRQQQQWEANRAAAYHGSQTHFLKSVYDNRVAEEGFLAQQVRLVPVPRAARGMSLLSKKKTRLTAAEQDSLRKWQDLPLIARLYPAARPIDSLRRISPDKDQVFLRFTHELQVCYFGEAPDPNYDAPMSAIGPVGATMPAKRQVSRLLLLAPETRIRPNGSLANPLDVVTGEYWGFQKIGDLLPLDYEPPVATARTPLPTPPAKAN